MSRIQRDRVQRSPQSPRSGQILRVQSTSGSLHAVSSAPRFAQPLTSSTASIAAEARSDWRNRSPTSPRLVDNTGPFSLRMPRVSEGSASRQQLQPCRSAQRLTAVTQAMDAQTMSSKPLELRQLSPTARHARLSPAVPVAAPGRISETSVSKQSGQQVAVAPPWSSQPPVRAAHSPQCPRAAAATAPQVMRMASSGATASRQQLPILQRFQSQPPLSMGQQVLQTQSEACDASPVFRGQSAMAREQSPVMHEQSLALNKQNALRELSPCTLAGQHELSPGPREARSTSPDVSSSLPYEISPTQSLRSPLHGLAQALRAPPVGTAQRAASPLDRRSDPARQELRFAPGCKASSPNSLRLHQTLPGSVSGQPVSARALHAFQPSPRRHCVMQPAEEHQTLLARSPLPLSRAEEPKIPEGVKEIMVHCSSGRLRANVSHEPEPEEIADGTAKPVASESSRSLDSPRYGDDATPDPRSSSGSPRQRLARGRPSQTSPVEQPTTAGVHVAKPSKPPVPEAYLSSPGQLLRTASVVVAAGPSVTTTSDSSRMPGLGAVWEPFLQDSPTQIPEWRGNAAQRTPMETPRHPGACREDTKSCAEIEITTNRDRQSEASQSAAREADRNAAREAVRQLFSEAERVAARDMDDVVSTSRSPDSPVQDDGTAFRFKAGAYTLGGRKLQFPMWENQDAYLVLPLPSEFLLAAVFDGHGLHGHHVAARVRGLFQQLAPSLVADFGPTAALLELFAHCEVVLQREGLCRLSGATATVALVDQRRGLCTVAHVGDSTLILSQGDKIVFSTEDHKVDEEAELRILAHGGEVRPWAPPEDNVMRVFARGMKWPGLSMSRALGDFEAKKLGVLAEPEITEGLVLEEGMTLALATDGVWETLPKESVTLYLAALTPEEAAQSLVLDARSRWPATEDIDDITMVVVKVEATDDNRPT